MLRHRSSGVAIAAALLISGVLPLARPAAAALARATLTSSVGNNLDGFGNSVATSGDIVVVGAPHHDAGGDVNSDEGAIFVYERGPQGWASGTEIAMLTASDATTRAQLGWAVAISGDVIAASAIRANGGEGAVYVFVKPASGWTSMTETAYLRSSSGDTQGLGYSLAMVGDMIVAGAPSYDGGGNFDSGEALMFEKPTAGWGPRAAGDITESMTLWPGAFRTGAAFGQSIAASGSTIVVGAPGESINAGAAYVYQADPTIGWSSITLLARLTASDAGNSDGLGTSVAVKGRFVALGAPCHDDVADSPCAGLSGLHTYGALYVYREPFTGWVSTTQLAELRASSPHVFDRLGAAVAITDDGIWGGAPGFNTVYRFVQPAGGWSDTTETGFEYEQQQSQFGKELAGAGHTLAISDSSGVHGGTVTVEVTDDTAPLTLIQVTPETPDGANDWYITSPIVSVSATDGGTGVVQVRCAIDPAVPPATFADLPATCAFNDPGAAVTSDGSHTIYAASIDAAGNASNVVTAAVAIDAAPPVTSVTLTPAAPDGANGWYRGPVTAVVSATDGGSGVAETRCVVDPSVIPATFDDLASDCTFGGPGASIGSDGTHILYAASIDNGGTVESIVTQTARIDGTDPDLACRSASFVLDGTGSVVADVTDATSGAAAATTSTAADTTSVGAKSISLTATDLAGNIGGASCPYIVGYLISGPIGLKSTYRVGSVVPVRIALAAAGGIRISDASAETLASACGVRVGIAGDPWTCAKYDPTTDQFVAALRSARTRVSGLDTIVVEVLAGGAVVNHIEASVTFR